MQPDRGCSVAPLPWRGQRVCAFWVCAFRASSRSERHTRVRRCPHSSSTSLVEHSEARRRGEDVPRLAANRAVAGPLPGERQRLGASCRSASGWCYLDTGSAPTARPATGAPASSPNPSALNTDTFPPSRLLATPSTPPGAPSGVAGTPPPGTSTPPPAPTGADPNLPATASGGRLQGGSTRTGKNPSNERYDDCVKLWDSRTHMSKAEWSRTCRRIENRLQNLQVENLDVDVSGPKPRRTGKSPGGSG